MILPGGYLDITVFGVLGHDFMIAYAVERTLFFCAWIWLTLPTVTISRSR